MTIQPTTGFAVLLLVLAIWGVFSLIKPSSKFVGPARVVVLAIIALNLFILLQIGTWIRQFCVNLLMKIGMPDYTAETLILVVVLAALGGAIWWMWKKDRTSIVPKVAIAFMVLLLMTFTVVADAVYRVQGFAGELLAWIASTVTL